MKIYLTKNDIRKILAERFGLKFYAVGSEEKVCLKDELYWEGNDKVGVIKQGERKQ